MATRLREFEDSTSIAQDQNALRERMKEQGYLFFRRLIDPERILQVRRDVANAIAAEGWLEEGSDPMEARPGPTVHVHPNENWWGGYVAIQKLESYHSLAHEPALIDVISRIVDGELVVQPMKIARVTYPNSDYPTPPHQDYFFVRGSSDIFTAWIPLGDCPSELGGVRVIPGSHWTGLRSVSPAKGAGNITADVEEDAEWLGTEYEAGDVLMFHSLTIHTAPSNQSDRVRLSADFRYQSNKDPFVAGVLFPHEFGRGQVPPWHQLTQDWSTTRWIEVPECVNISRYRIPVDETPRSRLLEG